MNFCEKLNFLMDITNTTNSALAVYTSMDASYISRLRRGERSPSKNEEYMKSMATFFGKRFTTDYQLAALRTELGINIQLQPNPENISNLIFSWLHSENDADPKSVEGLLRGFSNFTFKKPQHVDVVEQVLNLSAGENKTSVYYGIDGKREAVLMFLSLVLQAQKPVTLLLFSDENFSWMTEDSSFRIKWATLFSHVLMKGNKIKIIHTVNRDLNEMLAAISEWLPIYMTGAVEPYYCPKTRDGIFRRTLFIAPGIAALASNSIGQKIENSANLLFTQPKITEAFSLEFDDYLFFCRPLMRIFNKASQNEYLSLLQEFEAEDGDAIIKSDSLSLMTMPAQVIESVCSRISDFSSGEHFRKYHITRNSKFEENLSRRKTYEIIKLPDIEEIINQEIVISFSDITNESHLTYEKDEFKMQLENIVRLLQTYENYNVHLHSEGASGGYLLYVKEDVGVFVMKTAVHSVLFAINESNMTKAFYDYLNNFIVK